MAGRVQHIAVVRDEIDAIADSIRASIERGAELIFTCGGLGPTDDDLTLAALAKATDRKLHIDAATRDFVERRYQELVAQGYVGSAEMSEPRLKMARLPEGGRPIENPAGSAPGVVVEVNHLRIVSLPGGPA